jgi:hypothetical protein
MCVGAFPYRKKTSSCSWRAKRGAHLLLQTRVKTLNQELGAVFQRWYPDLQLEECLEEESLAACPQGFDALLSDSPLDRCTRPKTKASGCQRPLKQWRPFARGSFHLSLAIASHRPPPSPAMRERECVPRPGDGQPPKTPWVST